MEYDLTITCMLSFAKEKHIKAAENFSKKGLLNIKDKKIFVNFLLDQKFQKNFESLSFDYPYKAFYFPKDNVDYKIYNFYAFHGEKLSDIANWHIQVDDDSITDINGLVEDLDNTYDPNIPIRFICGELYDIHPSLEMMLNEYRINFSTKIKDNFIPNLWRHEWEFGCSSKAYFKKIFSNNDTKVLLKLMSLMGLNGDHGLTALAMINKIPIISYRHAHFANLYQDFSLNGGNYFHIHYVDEKTFDKVENFNFSQELIDKKFKLIKHNFHEGFSILKENLILKKSGQIEPNSFDQNTWKFYNNTLFFYNAQGLQSCFFKFSKNLFEKHKIIPGQFTESTRKESALLQIY